MRLSYIREVYRILCFSKIKSTEGSLASFSEDSSIGFDQPPSAHNDPRLIFKSNAPHSLLRIRLELRLQPSTPAPNCKIRLTLRYNLRLHGNS